MPGNEETVMPFRQEVRHGILAPVPQVRILQGQPGMIPVSSVGPEQGAVGAYVRRNPQVVGSSPTRESL